MKKTILILSSIIAAVSCSEGLFDDAAEFPLVELGAKKTSYVIDAAGGVDSLLILSNGEYSIEPLSPCSWITFETMTSKGDSKIRFTAEPNTGFKRKSVLVLKSAVGTRTDTLEIRQKAAVEAVLDVHSASLLSSGAGGLQQYPVTTNIPFGQMTVTCDYVTTSDEQWVEEIGVADNTLSIRTFGNSTVEPRIARIRLSFTDGWGEEVSVEFNLIQKNKDEVFGRDITFGEFRSDYSNGDLISDYVVIEGLVVSNAAGGNAGENEQITATTIDYTTTPRTVYLESPDGNYGIQLVTKTAEDNIFEQFDRVSILLKGGYVEKVDEPLRYTVTGITKEMILSKTSGVKSDIPVKEKHIADLTDDDIFTYVTLKDVEFPVRKGPVAPINEGYAIGTNAHRISKYPRLIRDINGDVSYVMTNTVCLYRNDGTVLPYGSGKMSGVIVHERFTRFEFKNGANIYDIDTDPELGFISRYQLRHQTKSDIWEQMRSSVEDGFSALLTEYRFVNPDPDTSTHSALPTYGTNGRLTHTFQCKYTGDTLKHKLYQNSMPINFVWTFSYLGPVGNNAKNLFGLNKGNLNGIGVILDPAKEHWPEWPSWQNLVSTSPVDGTLEWCGPYATSEDVRNINLFNGSDQPGKAICPWGTRTGFSNQYWWDIDSQRPYGWLLEFSTKGISTNHLSLQFTALNYARYTPRYWKVEWSYQDAQDAAHDADWHEVGRYTVPDIIEWSVSTLASLCAYKQFNFDLPLEILDQDKVYLRFVPRTNEVSSGASYTDCAYGSDGKTAHESAINYIAIRYNK